MCLGNEGSFIYHLVGYESSMLHFDNKQKLVQEFSFECDQC